MRTLFFLILSSSCLTFADGVNPSPSPKPVPAPESLAVSTLNSELLDLLSFTQGIRVDLPAETKDGVTTQTSADVTATVRPKVGYINCTDAGCVVIDVDLSGAGVVNGHKPIGRKRDVWTTAGLGINAHYSESEYFSAGGLGQSGVYGGSNIGLTSVGVDNNFRLLHRLVNRKAAEKTIDGVNEAIPAGEKKINDQARAALTSTVGGADQTARGAATRMVEGIKAIFPKGNTVALEPQIRTFWDGSGAGKIEARLWDRSGKPQADQTPEPVIPPWAMTQVSLKEGLLPQSLGKDLAGQSISFGKFQKILCRQASAGLLDFCQTKMPEEAAKACIFFDKDQPLEMQFRDNRMVMRVNAKFRRLKKVPDVKPDSSLYACDSKFWETDYETLPYTLEVAYKLDGNKAKLDKIVVRDRPENHGPLSSGGENDIDYAKEIYRVGKAVATHISESKKADRSESDSESASESDSKGRWGIDASKAANLVRLAHAVAPELLSPAERAELESAMRKVVKPVLDFNRVPLPLQMTRNAAGGMAVAEAGTLVPSVKSKDGWLTMMGGLCRESMEGWRGIGLVWQKGDKNQATLKIDNIAPWASLWNEYFKPNDRIEAFGEPDSELKTLGWDATPINNLIRKLSENSDLESRVIEVSGTDSEGKKFRRKIPVCPTAAVARIEAAQVVTDAMTPKKAPAPPAPQFHGQYVDVNKVTWTFDQNNIPYYWAVNPKYPKGAWIYRAADGNYYGVVPQAK